LPDPALLIGWALGVGLVSAAVTAAMVRVGVMDIPNRRSSHAQATPRAGGVGIVVAVTVGLAAWSALGLGDWLWDNSGIVFLLSAFALAAVSLVDDLIGLSFKIKLSTQLVVSITIIWFLEVPDKLALPFVGPVGFGPFAPALAVLWIVGLTNAVNFMDGLNGLAAGTALAAGLALALIAARLGHAPVMLASLALAAAAAGFLPFNFPGARIFMGDVGSQFLGFTFAVLGLWLVRDHPAAGPFGMVPLLFFAMLFDVAFTLWRRWRAGDRLTEAHRSHLYQVLVRAGFPHAGSSLVQTGFAVFHAFLALAVLGLPPLTAGNGWAAALFGQLLYLSWVRRRAATRDVGKW
jgi:UDP-GlcNAc:undecaprenyl-phosphate GlcNAc-1-phosphate transferase